MRAWMMLSMVAAVGCFAKSDTDDSVCTFVTIEEEEDVWCAPARRVTSTCAIDGDTFDLATCGERGDDTERVRMLGMQAPELDHGDEPAECYGVHAYDFLDSVLDGHMIRLDFDEECEGVFGRTLAHAFVEAGPGDPLRDELARFGDLGVDKNGCVDVLISELMIRAGYTRLYEPEPTARYYDRLVDAERQAQDEGQGLWSDCE